MRTYKVLETIEYKVEANSEEEAEQIIIDSADRDKFFSDVVERDAFLYADESGEAVL